MSNEPLTLRGKNSRERILNEAAQLVGEKGVRGTSLDDIRVAASASKSQLYHYFTNKEDLVLAVIGRQADLVLGQQKPLLLHLDSWEALETWREGIISYQEQRSCMGGCPLGSLASELSDQDESARLALVDAFDEWEGYLRDGFTRMKARGVLRAEADPDELAVAVMTSLQGGLLLTQTRKNTQPIRVALHTAFAYLRTFASTPVEATSN